MHPLARAHWRLEATLPATAELAWLPQQECGRAGCQHRSADSPDTDPQRERLCKLFCYQFMTSPDWKFPI